jgi:hypothetical protein
VSPTDLLPIADLSASETKAITAKDLLEGVVINMDAGSIPVGKIDFTAGIPDGNINVTQGDVVLGRTIGPGKSQEIPCTAAGRALLAGVDAAAQRTSLGLGTLATRSGSWVDGSSFSGTSSGTNTGDQTITLTGPVTGSGKGTFATVIAAGAIGTVQLGSLVVTTDKLAEKGVAAAKVADNSVVVVSSAAPAGAGSFIGQGAFSSATGVAYTYTGSAWVQHAGVQGITITESNTPLSFSVSGTTSTVVDVSLDNQATGTVWAGPDSAAAGVPTFRRLVGTDLPGATAGVRGAVKPDASFTVDGNAQLSLNTATSTVMGGVKVAGPDLQVDATGQLKHVASTLVAGDYTKVTTDANGHVIGGQTQIGNADIANLDAGKLTQGILPAARIDNNSIAKEKLANYATTIIQETDPGPGSYIGQFWYRESDAQLRTWSANSWIPVGFGRLSQENLRFCGTFNAATGQVTQVTTFGTTAGLTAGAAIPAATEQLTGVYLVATTPGTYNTEVYDNGDWVLCIGTQWIRVDTLASAGGGSTINLGDLLNVTLTTPQSGDSLIFDASTNTWKNRTTHGVKITLIEAFDGVRTSFTTSRQVVSENNLLVSVGGVIQEPGVDFTAPPGGNTINFLAPPPSGSDHWVLQEAAVDGGGGGGGGGTVLLPGTAAEEYLKWNPTLNAWRPSDTLDGGGY